MNKSIYSDKDYFDNMFKEIKADLMSLKEEVSGSPDRPGLRDRVGTIEKNFKIFVASLPVMSALYIKESRDVVINLFKVLMP